MYFEGKDNASREEKQEKRLFFENYRLTDILTKKENMAVFCWQKEASLPLSMTWHELCTSSNGLPC